jgi:nitronate monooxygenase
VALPDGWEEQLTLPLVAAPMTQVSGVELVVAACRAGVIGSFPTHNATPEELPRWLERISHELSNAPGPVAPFAANVVVHASNPRRDADIDALVGHGVEIVITSVGSPAAVLPRFQQAGCTVLADVGSVHHAERAIAAGVDGLVLLSAGAGGQTGWLNPLAYIRAVRRRYDGLIVLAGGIADGAALAAAITAGADLAYMGTRFIATIESAAPDAYKRALVAAGPDDVALTTALTGLQANVLSSSIPADANVAAGAGFEQSRLFDYKDVWSAGHSVCGVQEIVDVAVLVDNTRDEYLAAARSIDLASGLPRTGRAR